MEKLLKSIFIGLIGSLLLPLSFYCLLLAGALYEHKWLIGFAPDISHGLAAVAYFIWLMIIVPIINVCIGSISLKINSKSGLVKYDYILLPLISGIITSILGLLLYTMYQVYSIHPSWMFVWNRLTDLPYYFEGLNLLFIIWPICSLLGISYYNKIPDFSRLHVIIRNMPKKYSYSIICLFVITSILVLYAVISHGSIYITDAYCDSNTHFNFTIVNTEPSDLNIIYNWHLDDPKADKPRPIWNNGWTNDYYIGNGTITVPGKSSQNIVVTIPLDSSYPQNYLVMDIELFDENKSVYHYREQKPSSQWDYSTLPPRPL